MFSQSSARVRFTIGRAGAMFLVGLLASGSVSSADVQRYGVVINDGNIHVVNYDIMTDLGLEGGQWISDATLERIERKERELEQPTAGLMEDVGPPSPGEGPRDFFGLGSD